MAFNQTEEDEKGKPVVGSRTERLMDDWFVLFFVGVGGDWVGEWGW